jgi:excisionase family DNA binding protein
VNDADLDDDVLTVEEAARFLKVGKNCLYDAIGRGQVPHRRIGKHIRISRAGLMRWLATWSQDAQGST